MTKRNKDWAATLYDQQHEVWSAWSEGEGDSASVASFLASAAGASAGLALDLGCGVGREACALAALGWSVTGIDLSETLVQKAEVRAARLAVAPKTEFDAYDLTAAPLPPRFDLVYSWDSVFAIWDEAGQLELVRSWCQSLKPGGLFAIGQLNRTVFSRKDNEVMTMAGDWIGAGRTERRLHWCAETEEYLDSVKWFPESGLPRELPTQRLKLLGGESLVGILKEAGLVDVVLIGTDGWSLSWPGVRPPTEDSNQVIAIGRRPY